jgi:hypothetical protein
MGAELSRTLLPWYESDAEDYRTAWDYDEVVALQEDQNDLAKRYQVLFDASLLMRSECREALGYDSTPEDKVFKKPLGVDFIGPGAPEPEPAPQLVPPPAAGNVPPPGSNGQPDAVAAQQRAFTVKQGTLEEWLTGQIGRYAQRLEKPPTNLRRVATRLMREEQRLQPRFQQMILPVLQRYGEHAATATREIFPTKVSVQDMIRTSMVHERLPIASISVELRAVYEEIGAIMTDLITDLYKSALNLELTSDARLKTMVQQAAGERVLLLDLPTEARASILRTLDEATQQGLSEEAVIDLIKERVPAGRWSTSELRSKIIARSESRYAGNIAASQFASESGAGRVLVLDALLGPTDETCEVRNGWVVTPAEGRALAASEHPNGTLMLVSAPATITASRVSESA